MLIVSLYFPIAHRWPLVTSLRLRARAGAFPNRVALAPGHKITNMQGNFPIALCVFLSFSMFVENHTTMCTWEHSTDKSSDMIIWTFRALGARSMARQWVNVCHAIQLPSLASTKQLGRYHTLQLRLVFLSLGFRSYTRSHTTMYVDLAGTIGPGFNFKPVPALARKSSHSFMCSNYVRIGSHVDVGIIDHTAS